MPKQSVSRARVKTGGKLYIAVVRGPQVVADNKDDEE